MILASVDTDHDHQPRRRDDRTQVVLALLIVVASIHVTRRCTTPSLPTIRTGVASGVSAISWIAFLPIALVFGVVSTQHGVHTAGWILTALTVLTSVLLARVAMRRPRPTAAVGGSTDHAPAITVDAL